METLFVPCEYKADIIPVLKKILSMIGNYKRIGLVTTAQHLSQLDKAGEFLGNSGKDVVVGGQVLGCNQEAATAIEDKVDAFLYIGSGRFHPLGISLKTEKPVFVANPYSNSVDEISEEERERWLKKKKGRIARSLSAEKFGILVSTKEGQFNLPAALSIQKKLEAKGKKAILFAGSELSPDRLLGYDIGCWVNTACPRLVDDEFDKAVLNPDELELL